MHNTSKKFYPIKKSLSNGIGYFGMAINFLLQIFPSIVTPYDEKHTGEQGCHERNY